MASSDLSTPQFKDLEAAHQRIRPFIVRTPVVRSKELDEYLGVQLFLKCENQQEAGSFKYRGATNAVQCLSSNAATRGVATHSSGNHASALALAAAKRNIPAYIVMPENAPEIKVERVKSFGGKITFCTPTLRARESTLMEVIEATGATFIPPYDYFEVICGQGTAAIELLDEVGQLDVVMTPVGGGGLLSGTAISVKHLLPSARVIAGEPANADDAYRSFKSGHLIPSNDPNTIADGLKTSLGVLNFSIIRRYVDDIIPVTEDTIREAMKVLHETTGIMAEPSSAVPLAAVMQHPEFFRNKRIGIIITGGNISPERFRELC